MIEVRLACSTEMEQLFAIRREVFVRGQGVPIDREIDGLDGDATHFIAVIGDKTIGTARLRVVDGHAKVERVAVREPWRGCGAGSRLMDAVECHARAIGLTEVVLSAQVAVIPFYERRGYAAHGPVFEDAGIAHRSMHKTLCRE
ncbi:MAG TPA: GNAT family N-acetyltransferase [Candidatus Limnocylindrales bacterium]|nr:GNAT family N-acetyltransferase [Candidatus Limnocylindrales bacterium]